MIIRSTTLSPSVVLCAGFGTADIGPRGFDAGKGGRKTQVAEGLRAPAVQVFDRGNVNRVVTWRVVRQFPDLKAAEVYRATYAKSVEGLSDKWEFRSQSDDGTVSSCFLVGLVRRAASGAANVSPNKGISVEVEYEISGGEFTTT